MNLLLCFSDKVGELSFYIAQGIYSRLRGICYSDK